MDRERFLESFGETDRGLADPTSNTSGFDRGRFIESFYRRDGTPRFRGIKPRFGHLPGPEDRRPEEEDEGFVALTEGDEDFGIRPYFGAAQVPSAHGEKELYDAREKARRALQQNPNLKGDERKRLEQIAGTGTPSDDEGGGFFGGILGLFNLLDTPGELVRAFITDIDQRDQQRGGKEITLRDYWDILIQNDQAVRERLGEDIVGDTGDFLFEGRMFLQDDKRARYGVGVDDTNFGEAAGGFLLDVLLDPLTYVTFGAAGVGRKAVIETTEAVAAGGWKSAIRAVRNNAVKELDDPIEQRAARLIEERIARETDDMAADLGRRLKAEESFVTDEMINNPQMQKELRDQARERILREEESLVDAVGGVSITEHDAAKDALEALTKRGTDIEFNTAFHDELAEMVALQAERRYSDFAKKFPEYIQSKAMPAFAKGGVRVVPTPFLRKNLPMLTIPGTRTNAPFSRFANRILDKLPESTRHNLTQWGKRFSRTRTMLNRAKEWEPDELSPYVFVRSIAGADEASGAFSKTKLGMRLHEMGPEFNNAIQDARRVAKKAGLTDDSIVDNAVRRIITGDMQGGLKLLPDSETRQVALQSARNIAAGLKTIFHAAEQVGMPVRQMENFMPVVTRKDYKEILKDLAERGAKINPDDAIDGETRFGLEILSEYAGRAGEQRPSLVSRLGESEHARSRIAAATHRSGLADEDVTVLSKDTIQAAFEQSGIRFYDHEQLNRSVMKALNHLAERNQIDPRAVRKLKDEPYWTDLAEILESYTQSMSEAIRLRDVARRFKKAGMLINKTERISVTRTLAGLEESFNSAEHPVMKFLDDLADAVEQGTTASVQRRLAKPVPVTVAKNWTVQAPEALVGSKAFNRSVEKLKGTLDRVLRNDKDARRQIEASILELKNRGVPEEMAALISTSSVDSSIDDIFQEVFDVVDDEIDQLKHLAGAQVATNAKVLTEAEAGEQMVRAAREAADLRKGVEGFMQEIREGLNKRLGVTIDVDTPKATTLNNARAPVKGDNRSFMQWLADEGENLLRGGVDENVDTKLFGDVPVGEALPVVREAVNDLYDGLEMAGVTVGDVIEFAGRYPERAAASLAIIYDKTLQELGPEAAQEVMRPSVREAIQSLHDAHEILDDARRGLVDVTVESAEEAVIEARAVVGGAMGELSDSDVLLGDIIRDVAPTVYDLTEDPLFSPSANELWATMMSKIDNMPDDIWRAQHAENERFAGKKLTKQSQRELTAQGSKTRAREIAAIKRHAWVDSLDQLIRKAEDVGLHTEKPLEKAIRAVRANDLLALPNYEDEIRALVGHLMPALDWRKIEVRPNGSIVYVQQGDELFVTIDDVLPDLRAVVPDADNMDIPELIGTAVEAWRADPDAMEGYSERLARWFRAVDEGGGFDYDLENYEYLKDFATRLMAVEYDAARIVKQGGSKIGLKVAANPENYVYHVTSPRWADKVRQEGMKNGGLFKTIDEAREFVADRAKFKGNPQDAVVFAFPLENLHDFQRRAMDRYGIITDAFRGAEDVPAIRPVHDFRLVDGPAPAIKANKAQTRAVEALNEVLDAVKKVKQSGEGVGAKSLRNTWEKNVATIRKSLPVEIVDRARTLVDDAVDVRALTDAPSSIPRRIKRQQLRLQSDRWEPLDNAWTRFNSEVEAMANDAIEQGSEDLLNAAADLRYFQERVAHLMSFGDDFNEGISPGRLGLDDAQHTFRDSYKEAKASLLRALDAVEKIADEDKTFFDELLPPIDGTPQSIQAWIRKTRAAADNWKPKTVSTQEMEGFVSLGRAGLVGDVFGEHLAERHVAIVLENMAARYASLSTEGGITDMISTVDSALKWWRAAATVARPTFVPRNVIGGIFNGTIIGVGPQHYAFSAKNILPAVRKVRRGVSTWDEVIAEASPSVRGYLQGIRHSDVLQTSFALSSLDHLKRRTPLRNRLNPFSSKNALFYQGGRIMEYSEDFLRAAAFVAHFDPKRPATMGAARALTLAVHFDYAHVSAFEKNIKRLVPFFTWTKNNIPLQFRAVFENPGVYAKYRHAVSNLQAWQDSTFVDEAGFADSEYRGALAIPTQFVMGDDSAWWNRIMLDPDLPFKDLEEILEIGKDPVPRTMDFALRLAAPQYSAPIDIMGGFDYDVPAPTGLAEFVRLADKVIPGYDPVKTIDGKVLVPGAASSGFRTLLPFLSENLEVLGFTPNSPNAAQRLSVQTGDGVELGERAAQSALRFGRAFGINSQIPADSERQSYLAEEEIDEILDRARLEGRSVDPEDMSAIVDAILEQEGIEIGTNPSP